MREQIKSIIVEKLLKDDTIVIDDNTPLISSAIIDSISTLKLVDYLEKEFNIEFEPHEVDKDNLDSIELIENFIKSKM
jgi:acyl carrier protein